MVGDDPEMLVSELQTQFPNEAIEVIERDEAGLVSTVVDLIERRSLDLPVESGGLRLPALQALHRMRTETRGTAHE